MPDVDAEAVGERLLRPDRAGAAKILSELGRISSAQEAWEALAARGLIPNDWTASANRWFVLGGERLAHPPSLGACVELAADARGVVTAESLAREVVARLAPWRADLPARVEWLPARRDYLHTNADWEAWRAANLRPGVGSSTLVDDVLFDAYCDVENAVSAGGLGIDNDELQRFYAASGYAHILEDLEGQDMADPDDWYATNPAIHLGAARLWDLATENGLTLGAAPRNGRMAPVGQAFAELPNPFAPALAICQTGYVLAAVTPRGALMLYPDDRADSDTSPR
jgi:hypothetical protein